EEVVGRDGAPVRSGDQEGAVQESAVDPDRDHGQGHRQLVQRLDEAQNPMSFINYSSREINCKLVYYGPGLCGKTTNLQYIYGKTSPEAKGKMISSPPRPNGRCSSTSCRCRSARSAASRHGFTS